MSRNPLEVQRNVEIALCVDLKRLSIEEFEKVFAVACPAAKNIVDEELNYSERKNLQREDFVSSLKTVVKITSYFEGVFDYLNKFSNINVRQIKSLLIATAEVLFSCFSHCKKSEEVYGIFFESLTEFLSDLFIKSCSLLDQFVHVLAEKVECVAEVHEEILLLNEMLNFLSELGILLLDLEVKTSAKVWKGFVVLSEKYVCFLKNVHNIDGTLKKLCSYVTSNMEALSHNFQEFSKLIKLKCFLLKIVIKSCEVFNGCLQNCQNSLLSLLLMLCKYDVTNHGSKTNSCNDMINQLTFGTNHLLSQLMTDRAFIRECKTVGRELQNSIEFSMLCCLILKKLFRDVATTRNLWFNENVNILEWIFLSASSSQFLICSNICFPNILINGEQKEFIDMYEYVLVTISAFSMTATAEEYCLIERTLIANILQMNPIRALLAIDIWCLLARFAGPELCFTQIEILSKMLQEFETARIEKSYLASLIQRIFCLLIGSHRKLFLQSFKPLFYSVLEKGTTVNCFTAVEACEVPLDLLTKVEHLLPHKAFITEASNVVFKISKLWKFNCVVLSSTSQSVRFLKIVCALTASAISDMPSENLLMVLTKIKKLLDINQQTCVKLYFVRILNSLSTVRIPSGDFQKKILKKIAEIFRNLLSSKEVFVKEKAFEIFYSFSHVTSHEEVISLSVLSAPKLKLEVTNYFKRKLPDQIGFSLNEYMSELHGWKPKHVCQEIELKISKKKKISSGDVEETVTRWKEDGKQIVELFQSLSEFQKKEVRNLCNSILSLPP